METDISIIIPVLNEQETINKTIKKVYQQNFPGILEIIVVDGKEDGTTILCVENQKVMTVSSPPGRGIQMNCGAKKASGKILLFLHSDTILPENALNEILNTMKDQSIKVGAFDLAINRKGLAYRVIEKTASLRSRMTKIPYGDQAIFIRKKYFFGIGQYREIPIMEDVELMRSVKKDKGRLRFLKSRTSTSSRRWEKEGIVFCTLRNWTILILFLLGMKAERLAGFYKNKI
ncbi:MAG: glycosyl transferase [Deltaproteobacteria bacterium]|nr:MAG: glycosyl transferase [Deltaproteobacteria bacterium]